ncbi:MAG: CxxC-x17-CxxC domain-containing protein [Thermoplasmatota archaeon]
MADQISPPASPDHRTTVNCTKCGKPATVPFTPTPGRPVFCRDCYVRPDAGGAPRGQGRPASFFPARAPPTIRKRMLAQGRKTHFIFDAKAALEALPGGLELKDRRAFLEGLFARGSRDSTEAAQEFLDAKSKEALITPDQRNALGHLLERYSFYR